MNPLKITCLLSALSLSIPAIAEQASEDNAVENENFSYKLGGKIRLRSETFADLYSNNGGREQENYLRRADLELSGRLWRAMEYELELKLDRKGKAELKTAELDYHLPANFSLALGRFDPDFGLELSGSSTWITAAERSAIWDLADYAGDGSGGKGIAIRQHQKHHFISLGQFSTQEGQVRDARLVYAPVQKKRKLLHFGYSFAEALDADSNGEIKSDLGVWSVGFSDNGNSSKLAREISSGNFAKDTVEVLEFAAMRGPASLQGEYLQRKLTGSSNQSNRSATGSYAQLAYTLTGEPRDYSIGNAKFGRIKPQRKSGAWEIFYRKDWLETNGETGMLSKKRKHGAAEVDVLGVNWYSLNNLKISANYLRGDTNGIDNDVGDIEGEAVTLQAQIKF
ncbi:MAG TPA: porin [Cellvibrio sp.]|nr:porin [Cellvibrio sp.]